MNGVRVIGAVVLVGALALVVACSREMTYARCTVCFADDPSECDSGGALVAYDEVTSANLVSRKLCGENKRREVPDRHKEACRSWLTNAYLGPGGEFKAQQPPAQLFSYRCVAKTRKITASPVGF